MSDPAAQQDVPSDPASAPAPSLAATCSKALTTAPLNTAELENLPQHMLVQLLGQVVAERDQSQAERDEARAQLKTFDDELSELKRNRYLVDPKLVQDRVDCDVWEERLQIVLAKWEPRTTEEGWTAHHSHQNYMNADKHLVYHKDAKCFGFILGMHVWPDRSKQLDMYQVMSSSLLLYRVCCLFGGIYINVEGQEGYKVVWSAEVKHKATGEALGFSEWKGAPLVRVSKLKAPAQFEADMLELLNVLFDAQMPHPYDGTVAGSVA